MNTGNFFRVKVTFDVPTSYCGDSNSYLDRLNWVTYSEYVTVSLPPHVQDNEQVEEYLYEVALSGAHEHVHYESLHRHEELNLSSDSIN